MKSLTLSLTLFSISFSLIANPVSINWWHSMSGELGNTVKELVEKYNKSQSKYKVNQHYKGNYTENLNAAIAAYRGKKQPHLVQVFEVGTLTMMNSNAVYPVHKLFKDFDQKINWNKYLAPVLSYYQDQKGQLMSMPFNSSTPVLYYNKDLLKKAGIKNPPTTWEELFSQSQKVVDTGGQCGAVVAWQSWILIENFSSIHDIPVADQENGFNGLNVKLQINNDTVAKNIDLLRKGIKSKVFSYEGRRSDPAKNAFISQKCAFMMDSSSSMSAITKLAKFNWSAAQLPYKEAVQPKNSIIGGATLWVFKGHKKDEYAAVSDFLRFVASADTQKWWHVKTGYLPITIEAYEALKKEGYYNKRPEQEVAIKQLLRSKPGQLNRGIRLGGFTQIRELINEELEKVWAGKVSAKQGLDNAVKKGNIVLKRYQRSVRKK